MKHQGGGLICTGVGVECRWGAGFKASETGHARPEAVAWREETKRVMALPSSLEMLWCVLGGASSHLTDRTRLPALPHAARCLLLPAPPPPAVQTFETALKTMAAAGATIVDNFSLAPVYKQV